MCLMNKSILWGWHSVTAGLSNPRRKLHALFVTKSSFQTRLSFPSTVIDPVSLNAKLPAGAIHQGVAAWMSEIEPLPLHGIKPNGGLVLALDQITDPHNVGALWRSAAVFGAQSIILTKQHSPPLDGFVAKSASGAMEVVPYTLVSNLVYAITELKKTGFFCVGMCEDGQQELNKVDLDPVILVIGAEDQGLRHLTKKSCDLLVSIPSAPFSTLNASVAGAIGLYHFYQKRG